MYYMVETIIMIYIVIVMYIQRYIVLFHCWRGIFHSHHSFLYAYVNSSRENTNLEHCELMFAIRIQNKEFISIPVFMTYSIMN